MLIPDASRFDDRQGTVRCRFENDSVAGRDRRHDAFEAEQDRRIPRGDHGRHTAWTLTSKDRLIRIEDCRPPPLDQIPRDKLHQVDGSLNVDFGFAKWFSVLANEQPRKFGKGTSEISCRLAYDSRPMLGCCARPGLECSLRLFEYFLNLSLGRHLYLA